jgi:hypothetical protein
MPMLIRAVTFAALTTAVGLLVLATRDTGGAIVIERTGVELVTVQVPYVVEIEVTSTPTPRPTPKPTPEPTPSPTPTPHPGTSGNLRVDRVGIPEGL